MNNIERLKIVVKSLYDKDCRFMLMDRLGLCDRLSDEDYVKRKFHMILKKNLNLENPLTFSEKMQWLKIHDRKDIYTIMVDKYLVKQYVANIIGEEHIIPTIGVWNRPDEIDFDTLPNRFVLKCNHNSGAGMYICKDKTKLDLKKIKTNLGKGLQENYYLNGREWPYMNVQRKIIAEKYMENATGIDTTLTDYKFYCFDGCCKFVQVEKNLFDNGRKSGAMLSLLDLEWKLTEFQRSDHMLYPDEVQKPKNFEKMVEFSNVLSQRIPVCRIDWYEVNGQLYFGEITLYPGSGYIEFEPYEYDYIIGSWIDLEIVKTDVNC